MDTIMLFTMNTPIYLPVSKLAVLFKDVFSKITTIKWK